MLEKKRTVPVKVPMTVYKWLEDLANKGNKTVPNLVLGWILDKYKNEFEIEGPPEKVAKVAKKVVKAIEETASEFAKEQDKNVFGSASEDNKKCLEKGAPEGNPRERHQDGLISAVRRTLSPLPHGLTKAALIRLLVSRGWEIQKAKDAVEALISTGIYEEDANAWLSLKR